jgi:hypothetical protein
VNNPFVPPLPNVSPPFDIKQMMQQPPPVGQYVYRGTTYFMGGDPPAPRLFSRDMTWYPITKAEIADIALPPSPVAMPNIMQIPVLESSVRQFRQNVRRDSEPGADGANVCDKPASPSLQEAGAQLRQLLQGTARSPSGSPVLITCAANKQLSVPPPGGVNAVPSMGSPNLGSPQVRSYESSANTSRSTSPSLNVAVAAEEYTVSSRANASTPPITECQEDIERIIAETENLALLSPIRTPERLKRPEEQSENEDVSTESQDEYLDESNLSNVSPPKPAGASPRRLLGRRSNSSSPQRPVSDGSSSPMGSPQRGTPKKSRLAAKFQMPMSPGGSDVSL